MLVTPVNLEWHCCFQPSKTLGLSELFGDAVNTCLACACHEGAAPAVCRYNSSCYSSLLQQVDATANMELMFVQCAATPTAAQQQCAQYAAIWMHPDDVQQLMAAGQLLPGAAAGSQQQATGAAAQPHRVGRHSLAAAAAAAAASSASLPSSSSFNARSWGGPALTG